MEPWRVDLYRNELYHHGILGMHWGKRNGPPYPLGAEDHSASEKKAGWRKSLDKPAGAVRTKAKISKEKTPLKVLSKPNEPSELHEDPKSPVAKVFAKFIPSVRKNLENVKDYTLKNKEGKTVGELTTETRSHGEEMNIIWLGVNSKHEGNGYGQSAMRLAIDDARKEGRKYVTLEVPTDSPNARHIYEKLGFKDTGEAMLGGEDDVWGGLTKMRLDL